MFELAAIMKRLISIVGVLLVVLLLVCTIGTFFGEHSSLIELCSHFRLAYCIAYIPCLMFFACARLWKLACVLLIAFVMNLVPIASLWLPAQSSPAGTVSQKITILQMNLWGGRNKHHDLVLETIRRTSPDVIGFSEITPPWEEFLQKELSDYKYKIVETRFGGVAFFSRFPASDLQVCYFGAIKRPRVEGTIDVNGTKAKFIFAHPVIPRIGSTTRNEELSLLAAEARNITEPFVLFGDLNCSPWSFYFNELLKNGSLRDSEQGFGPQPSWNAFMRFPLVPIDHCLTNSRVTTEFRRVEGFVGSDHLPVLVQLGLHNPN